MAGIGHQPDRDTQRLADEGLAVQIPGVVITSRAGVESVITVMGNRSIATLNIKTHESMPYCSPEEN
jgi:hypothetical protein